MKATLWHSYGHTDNISLFVNQHAEVLENLINICYVSLKTMYIIYSKNIIYCTITEEAHSMLKL